MKRHDSIQLQTQTHVYLGTLFRTSQNRSLFIVVQYPLSLLASPPPNLIRSQSFLGPVAKTVACCCCFPMWQNECCSVVLVVKPWACALRCVGAVLARFFRDSSHGCATRSSGEAAAAPTVPWLPWITAVRAVARSIDRRADVAIVPTELRFTCLSLHNKSSFYK